MIIEPNSGSGFAYSALPLLGHTEFEIRLLDYSGSRNSSLKLGLMRHRATCSESIPKPSEHRDNSCVWFKSRYKRKSEFQNNFGMVHLLRYYGLVDLTDLRQEDKMGLQLSRDGDLSFFVNGVSQGVAAHGIYQPGFHVYCFVELVEGYKAVEITRAGELHMYITNHIVVVKPVLKITDHVSIKTTPEIISTFGGIQV